MLLTSSLCVTSFVALLSVSLSAACFLLTLCFFISFLCPAWLIHMQKYKKYVMPYSSFLCHVNVQSSAFDVSYNHNLSFLLVYACICIAVQVYFCVCTLLIRSFQLCFFAAIFMDRGTRPSLRTEVQQKQRLVLWKNQMAVVDEKLSQVG